MKILIEQLRKLSLFEWYVMLVSMSLLPVIAMALLIFGYNKTRNILHLSVTRQVLVEAGTMRLEKSCTIAHMISIAARHGPYRANCLKQSVLLWWMLARRGISSDIVFGVLKEPQDSLDTHAWVECGGTNISDTKGMQQRFLAFEG